ncbi:MAG: hypothetical protein NUW37_12445 [Planctomycetes bacterium]|nr:hypothetical protein [Planctomycetota bacterium]
MDVEHDFAEGVQGKHYVPLEEMNFPLYLERDVRIFFLSAAKRKKKSVDELVNSVLRREMENFSELMPDAESDSGSKPVPKRKKA